MSTIGRAIVLGERAHARAKAKEMAALRKEEAKAKKRREANLRLARRWVKSKLAGKIKYRASIGEKSLVLDNEGDGLIVRGQKILSIPAEAKYHVVYYDTELRKTLRARHERDQIRMADDCPLEDRDTYWIEWGEAKTQYGSRW